VLMFRSRRFFTFLCTPAFGIRGYGRLQVDTSLLIPPGFLACESTIFRFRRYVMLSPSFGKDVPPLEADIPQKTPPWLRYPQPPLARITGGPTPLTRILSFPCLFGSLPAEPLSACSLSALQDALPFRRLTSPSSSPVQARYSIRRSAGDSVLLPLLERWRFHPSHCDRGDSARHPATAGFFFLQKVLSSALRSFNLRTPFC